MMGKIRANDRRKLIIIGASGHGRVVADIARQMGYEDIAFLDDNRELQTCGAYPVIGSSEDVGKHKDADVIVAIGNTKIREHIQEQIENVVHITTLIHPDAVIADDAVLGVGTVVMAGAVINPGTTIGKGCIINTCSSVDHGCQIGDFVHISVGAHIAGNVFVGNRTWIGIGASVTNNVNICGDCMIGAGAVVIKDIGEVGTYIGVPAERAGMDNQEKTHKSVRGGVTLSLYTESTAYLAVAQNFAMRRTA